MREYVDFFMGGSNYQNADVTKLSSGEMEIISVDSIREETGMSIDQLFREEFRC